MIIRREEDPKRRRVYLGQPAELAPVTITLGFGQDLAAPNSSEHIRAWNRWIEKASKACTGPHRRGRDTSSQREEQKK